MTTKTPSVQQLDDIRKQLALIGCKESSFITVELLFYDALTISRTSGDDPSSNQLLSDLKQLEGKQYKDTKELFRKSTQKEHAIKRFIVQFKLILTQAIKNLSVRTGKTGHLQPGP